MNITIDNYEAYLVDYLDGNLNAETTAELKAFVAAQDLDWSELTEELPQLEAPQIEYGDKEGLKKHRAVMPLYVKIVSAAATAGLLLTVNLWPEKSLPKMEPIAELKPILPERLITASETTTTLPPKTVHFGQPQVVRKEKPTLSETVSERIETPLIAQLEPQKAQIIPTSPTIDEPDFDLLAYRMNTHLAFAQLGGNSFEDRENDDREFSLISRGLLWLTHGRHDSFASLIGSGIRKAKQDFTEAATDMALTAYNNVSEQIEEAKEHWEEKREE